MATTKIQKEYLDDELPHILSGAGAPASTPAKIGNIYVDTTSGSSYIAKGTSSSADWKITGGGGVTFSGCRVTKSAVQSIGTTATAVTFDTETFDTDGYHDNVTNNSRLTVSSTAYYRIEGGFSTDANAVTRAQVKLNGTTIIADLSTGNTGASLHNGTNLSFVYSLTASDYIELFGYIGTTQNTTSGIDGCFFTITKLS